MKKNFFILLFILLLISCSNNLGDKVIENNDNGSNTSNPNTNTNTNPDNKNNTPSNEEPKDNTITGITKSLEVFIDGKKYGNNFYLEIDDYLKTTTHKIEIRNTGNERIFLSDSNDIQIINNSNYSVTYNIDFSEYQTCLEPGKSCFITVSIIPIKTLELISISIQIVNSSFFSPLSITLESKRPYSSDDFLYFSYDKYLTNNFRCDYDYSLNRNKKLNFGYTILNSDQSIKYSISMTNMSSSVFELTKDCVWIDGKDADCFEITNLYENIRLTPGNSYSPFDVIFTPNSIGEKSAVLHISNANNQQDFTVSLEGVGITSHKDFDGINYIIYEPQNALDYSENVFIASNVDNGFFTIRSGNNSNPKIVITEFDKDGNVVDTYNFGKGIYPDYVIKIDNVIRIYTASTSYYDFDINTKTLSNKKTCTYDEYMQNNLQEKAGKNYDKILSYDEYFICLYDRGFADIYKGDVLWSTVARLFETSFRDYDACVSGDYIYWVSGCEIGRIKIQDLIDDLEKSFG